MATSSHNMTDNESNDDGSVKTLTNNQQ